MGLAIVRAVMDEVAIDEDPAARGTIVRMRKQPGRLGGSGDGGLTARPDVECSDEPGDLEDPQRRRCRAAPCATRRLLRALAGAGRRWRRAPSSRGRSTAERSRTMTAGVALQTCLKRLAQAGRVECVELARERNDGPARERLDARRRRAPQSSRKSCRGRREIPTPCVSDGASRARTRFDSGAGGRCLTMGRDPAAERRPPRFGGRLVPIARF